METTRYDLNEIPTRYKQNMNTSGIESHRVKVSSTCLEDLNWGDSKQMLSRGSIARQMHSACPTDYLIERCAETRIDLEEESFHPAKCRSGILLLRVTTWHTWTSLTHDGP